jgi:hypothetical protein
MTTFIVGYSGNASRFKGFECEIEAETAREAVEKVYQDLMDANYFPKQDGTIEDCDGNVIADPEDKYIAYDGGYFSANEKTEDEE